MVAVDGATIRFAHPGDDGAEVPGAGVPDAVLSFVDGAYRVRRVDEGVSYVFAVTCEASSVTMAPAGSAGGDSGRGGRADGAPEGAGPVAGSAAGLDAMAGGWSGASLAAAAGMPMIVGCTAVVHRTGRRYEIDYDAGTGLPRRVRHSGGAQVLVDTDAALRYGYDAAGRLSQWVDRNGVVLRYRYDDSGRCVAQAGTGGVYVNAAVYLDDGAVDAPPEGSVAVFVETATAPGRVCTGACRGRCWPTACWVRCLCSSTGSMVTAGCGRRSMLPGR